MKHEDSKEPREWLEKAFHDFDAAKKLFEEDGFPDVVAFHCHQTAEKALKGALLFFAAEYPFTHDLTILLQRCIECDLAFATLATEVSALTPLYEEQRYPFDEHEPYTDEELQDFITAAEKVYELIKQKVDK